MKIYKGRRLGPKEQLPDVQVTVEGDGFRHLLRHRIYHSPTGMEWGYLGSGPADLARSILWDCLGRARALNLYMRFKNEFVARWGQEWEISCQEIQEWADKTEASLEGLYEP